MSKGNRFVKTSRKLSAKDFDAVERKLGFPLPRDLRAHYAKDNGGKPVERYFRTDKGYEQSLHRFLPMRYESYKDEPLLEERYVQMAKKDKLIRPSLIPFAIDEGENYYCFDMTDQSVKYCPLDVGEKPPERLVAGSLKAFIEGMVTEQEFYG